MERKQVQAEIADLMVRNEEVMRDLYRSYAQKFPALRSFWNSIAEDEESHAAWIRTLHTKMQAGMVDFSEQRFPLFAIRTAIKYIQEETDKAKRGEIISNLYALEVSLHIERGMLEGKFFEVFKDDSLELQIILEALQLGTREHFREIESAWKKEQSDADMEKKKA